MENSIPNSSALFFERRTFDSCLFGKGHSAEEEKSGLAMIFTTNNFIIEKKLKF